MAGVARLTPGQLNYWRDRPRRPDFTPGQAAYRREYRAKQNVLSSSPHSTPSDRRGLRTMIAKMRHFGFERKGR